MITAALKRIIEEERPYRSDSLCKRLLNFEDEVPTTVIVGIVETKTFRTCLLLTRSLLKPHDNRIQ